MFDDIINLELASKLIKEQFPEYTNLAIREVKQQGHDNRTYRLGDDLLIRMPTAKSYALKVPKEQKLLPLIAPQLTVAIPAPIKMGMPSNDYPFHFSIYKWLAGESANHLKIGDNSLEIIAVHLAKFLQELQSITNVAGLEPGQHNWWRGDHVSVYYKEARQQITKLANIINTEKAINLWDAACETKWTKEAVWIHGDFAASNILIKDNNLAGIIDFGGMGVGDPACDLVIAWTLLQNNSRKIFMQAMDLAPDVWLRARAWALWKSTFELCQIAAKNSPESLIHKKIISDVLA